MALHDNEIHAYVLQLPQLLCFILYVGLNPDANVKITLVFETVFSQTCMEELTSPKHCQDPENIGRASPWHKEVIKVVKQNKPIPELVFRQTTADVKQSGISRPFACIPGDVVS